MVAFSPAVDRCRRDVDWALRHGVSLFLRRRTGLVSIWKEHSRSDQFAQHHQSNSGLRLNRSCYTVAWRLSLSQGQIKKLEIGFGGVQGDEYRDPLSQRQGWRLLIRRSLPHPSLAHPRSGWRSAPTCATLPRQADAGHFASVGNDPRTEISCPPD